MTPYEELRHTADVRLRVTGGSLADLFAQAAEGMFALMNWRPGPPAEDVIEDVRLSAPDVETLLVDWLSELLYRSEADAICYTHFAVEPTRGEEMAASMRGLRGGTPIKFIKAVTYHDLQIAARDDGVFEATITLDT